MKEEGWTISPGVWLQRHRTLSILLSLLLLVSGGLVFWLASPKPTERLGLLHALTGPMAISENPMIEAELLAVEEINHEGGVLGHQIEAVVADSASSTDTAAKKAAYLIEKDKVKAIVGCWTSACRKSVRPIIEKRDNLLIYPMAYEGIESSPNIIYTGAAPNQQILPAVNWSFENLGTRFYLVGSDYIWPHSVNAIIQDQIRALGGTVVGESYLPFGSLEASSVVARILAAKPDVILSTVVGNSNPPLYRALREAGITSRQIPVISFSIAETEIQELPVSDINGHYAAWGYFESVNRATNLAFIERFRRRYGEGRVISDVMETAYFSVMLWARAVERCGSFDPSEVNQALLGVNYDAPEGIVTVDPTSRHTWRSFNIGQIEGNRTIRIVWSADHPIRPVPYPPSRSASAWDSFVMDLYRQWNQNWVNTDPNRAGESTR